ncbi:MAG: four helix bundle protein [Clostridia bacterium]
MIEEKEMENKQLILIPKVEEYIEYMLNIIVKLPRTEKFSIGSEYKLSMYQMLKSLLYLNKMNRTQRKEESLHVINKIDTDLNCQRIYLRIMKKQKWIDIKKFDIIMQKIYEMGKIIGGLTKFYAKNN